ncbi:P-loop containing nucleoside triphosphate hydrolase protein [Aspergillus sergii]|uniref:P-loop containing nucleoside triphosphate hydrolase protein n=1 Tax=Aspergillus sergii TaxID=1034303 RepID=A0A5N6WU06_9EURO|nr:P-loop containing nucleoside triphosphate hydrolase protein [Aspergillus sergii]
MHSGDQRPDGTDTSDDDTQRQNHTGEGFTYSSSMDSPTDDDYDEEPEDAVSLCLYSSDMRDHFVFPYYHLYDFQMFEIQPREWRVFPFAKWDPSLFGFEPGEDKKAKWIKTAKADSPLNRLGKMVGFDDVKKEFLSVLHRVKAARLNEAQPPSIKSLRLDLLISGDADSERSMIADLYKKLLEFLGVSSGCCWTKPDDVKCNMDYKEPGAIVLDNSISFHYHDRDKHVLIGLGSREHIRNILSQPWAKGRFHLRFDLKGYSEDKLLAILVNELKERRLKVQGGFNTPLLRMFIRQIGNWQDDLNNVGLEQLKSEIEKVISRWAERLEASTRSEGTAIMSLSGLSYQLQESDFFGSYPRKFYDENEFFKKLDKMVGMQRVKEAVKELVSRRKINYDRVTQGRKPLKTNQNYVFLGPPGTGKSTAATLFGHILADLGYVEGKEVVLKKPADFLSTNLATFKRDLKDTEGKVLVIDEAHSFYQGTGYGTDASYNHPKMIIDTIVSYVDNEPGGNRCIILIGYPDRMKEFYRNTNPGFQRRFPLEDAFVFENYDDDALSRILDSMLADDQTVATNDAKAVGMELLRRQRELPNFGNGGAVRNLLSSAYIRYSKRITAEKGWESDRPTSASGNDDQVQILLQAQDFDLEYDRGLRKTQDFRSLFHNIVGFETILGTFEGYQTMTVNMKTHGLDPREEVPFSFIFKGPPGSGKTTTARVLGEMYYSMGLLSTTEVIDCSVTDMIGEYAGQTGPKVRNLLERALGKTLFIDEAYRLGGSQIYSYPREALGELVDCMTKKRYMHKLVIVLAGYERSMDQLISTNEGLRSRFTELVFPKLRPKDCLRLLRAKLLENKINILSSTAVHVQKVMTLFKKLGKTEAWANARDVEAIAKEITRQLFMKPLPSGQPMEITLGEIARILKKFYRDRRSKKEKEEAGDSSES